MIVRYVDHTRDFHTRTDRMTRQTKPKAAKIINDGLRKQQSSSNKEQLKNPLRIPYTLIHNADLLHETSINKTLGPYVAIIRLV